MENVVSSTIVPIVLSNLISQHCRITRTRAKDIAILKSLRELADRLNSRFTTHEKLKLAMTCASFDQGLKVASIYWIGYPWQLELHHHLQTLIKTMLDEHKKSSIETGILNGYWDSLKRFSNE